MSLNDVISIIAYALSALMIPILALEADRESKNSGRRK